MRDAVPLRPGPRVADDVSLRIGAASHATAAAARSPPRPARRPGRPLSAGGVTDGCRRSDPAARRAAPAPRDRAAAGAVSGSDRVVRPAGRQLCRCGAGARLRARDRSIASAPRAASARRQAAARARLRGHVAAADSEVRDMKHSERGRLSSRAIAADAGRDRSRERDAVARRNRGHGALGCGARRAPARRARGPAASCAGRRRRRRESRSFGALAWQRNATVRRKPDTTARCSRGSSRTSSAIHDRGRRRRTAHGRRADSRRAHASRAIGPRRAGHSVAGTTGRRHTRRWISTCSSAKTASRAACACPSASCRGESSEPVVEASLQTRLGRQSHVSTDRNLAYSPRR